MSRRITLAVLLCAVVLPAAAQQPDFRVRIFSLQRITAATVMPAPEASMSRCSTSAITCRAVPLTSPLVLRAEGSKVIAAGSAHIVIILKGKLKIEPAGGAAAETNAAFASGGMQSRTWSTPLEVTAHAGQLVFIAKMGLEDYTAAAVQGETSGEMPPEALKAMAVAARSYATHFRGRRLHQGQGFELCDNTHCQRLRGEVTATVRAAVEATRGQLLWDRGTPAAAYHHKDCGGRTESAEYAWPGMDAGASAKSASTASATDTPPGVKQSTNGSRQPASYLVSHDDPYCVRASHGWKAEITRADLERSLAAAGIYIPSGWEHIAIARRTPSGRAAALRFEGSSGAGTTVSASSVRFAVGRTLGWGLLKSDWYEIARSGPRFTFFGRGFGHGVGLCQTGAIEMAKAGKNYQEILAFYYPGAAIGVSAQDIDWEKLSSDSFDVLVARGQTGSANAHARGVRVMRAAAAALAAARASTGLQQRDRFEIRMYLTVAMFRDATGEPGWVAAITRGRVIHLQPPEVLSRTRAHAAARTATAPAGESSTSTASAGNSGGTEVVLHHELTHLLIESAAAPVIPLWFREGLALYLSDTAIRRACNGQSPTELEVSIRSRTSRTAMQSAYASAAASVEMLIRRHGKAEVIGWLSSGLPAGVSGNLAACREMAEHTGNH